LFFLKYFFPFIIQSLKVQTKDILYLTYWLLSYESLYFKKDPTSNEALVTIANFFSTLSLIMSKNTYLVSNLINLESSTTLFEQSIVLLSQQQQSLNLKKI